MTKMLPDKPSELIALALDDFKKIEAQPDIYQIDMTVWHEPDYGSKGTCAVCFAGAIMAKELGCKPFDECGPSDFDEATFQKLRALDAFRSGFINSGMFRLKISSQDIEKATKAFGGPYIHVGSYHNDPEIWHQRINFIVETFRSIGL